MGGGVADPVWVTIAEARTHLQVTDTDHDTEIGDKVLQAEAVIRGYLGAQSDPTWTIDTVPPEVRAAVLIFLGRLWVHRGDDETTEGADAGAWGAVENLLRRRRDPVVA